MPTAHEQPDNTQRTPESDAAHSMLEEDELDPDALDAVVGGLARPMTGQPSNMPFRNGFAW